MLKIWWAWVDLWRTKLVGVESFLVQGKEEFQEHGTLHYMAILNSIKISINPNYIRTTLDSKR